MTDQTRSVDTVHPNKRFCANHEPGLKCPKCGEEDIYVREQDLYHDGYEYEAYCDSCNAPLRVFASVTIEFCGPGVVDVD